MRKLFYTLSLVSLFATTSCTVMQVSEKRGDGYFNSVKNAEILLQMPFDLDSSKQLLVVPNSVFMKGMAEKIGYFDKVITFDDLEKEIIRENKQDEVGALTGKIGINNAYRKYKKFLYLKFDNNADKQNRIQLKLINPENFDDLFVADTAYDPVWSGVNDQNTFNPLFNALIVYIKENSKTYK